MQVYLEPSILPSGHWGFKPPKLTTVSTRLVGANGFPLQAQGSTVVELTISGQTFKQELIIFNLLTSEGILGLNFQEEDGCILDLVHGEVIARDSRVALSVKIFEPTTAQVVIYALYCYWLQ